jgi:hypothetical protein
MTKNGWLRLTFALALVPTGAVLVLLAPGLSLTVSPLLSGLGISLIVAGIVTAFREVAILRLESEEMGEEIATRVHRRLVEAPPTRDVSIRLVSRVRRGYDGYYAWVTSAGARDLFFAGRSVLHRMDADFRARRLPPVEQVLERKLRDGSAVRILFLDPRSELVGRLAREEGQTATMMLSDIATSLGVCRRLHELLARSPLPATAQLQIRVYDEVPYFSYHRQGEHVIVGFYFVTALGSQSAAFEVVDAPTRSFFEGHFTTLFDRSSDRIVLEVSPNRGTPAFNEELYAELTGHLARSLGKAESERLLLTN